MASKEPTVFSERFSTLVNESGQTQRQIAKGIGVALGMVSEWKMGNKTPRADSVKKIAEYFNVSPEWLFGTTEVRSIAPEMRAKAESVGLSEKAFNMLANDMVFSKDEKNMISSMIENGDMKRIISRLSKIKNDETSDMCEFLLWKEFMKIVERRKESA